jgi:competence protein ComEC
MNHWHKYPFVRILIPFVIGIILAVNFQIYISIFVHGLFLIIILFISFAPKRKYKWRFVYGIVLSLLLLLAGIKYSNHKLKFSNNLPSNKTYAIRIRINNCPEIKKKSVKVIANIIEVYFEDSVKQYAEKMLLYFQKNSRSEQLKYGDELIVKSEFKEILPPMNPNGFNYKRYLKFKQIRYQLYVKNNDWKCVNEKQGNVLIHVANKCREYLLQRLEQCDLDSELFGIASALLLGYDQVLESETRDHFSDAGAMHVLCVSGLHVGIIYLIFSTVFSFLKRFKNGFVLRGILILLLLWFYAMITAFSPSVLRASCMLSFIVFGEMMNRKSNVYNTIAASAFLLLLINPLMLMELGFQLSYIAMIGIVSIYPIIKKYVLLKNHLVQKLLDIIIVSVAAQLATFPLVIYYFHQFPIYFLLTNLIVVSFAGILIYLGFSFFIFSEVPIFGSVLAFLLKKSLFILNAYVSFINSLPLASVEGLVLSILSVIIIYILIISAFRAILKRNKIWLIVIICSLLLLSILFVVRKNRINHTHKFVCYQVGKHLALDFISSGKNVLIVDRSLINEQKIINYAISNHWIINGIKEPLMHKFEKDSIEYEKFFKYKSCINFRGKNILVVDDSNKLSYSSKKIKMDYLVLRKNPKYSIKFLDSVFNPDVIIINMDNSLWKQKQWEEENVTDVIIWSILNEGAYVAEFD